GRVNPPGWMVAPSKVLLKLGGAAFASMVPRELEYMRGPELEIALYPSDLLLRAKKGTLTRARGVIAEVLGPVDVLQTTDPASQAIEKEIGWGKRVREPLAATRKTLKEDAQWMKERTA